MQPAVIHRNRIRRNILASTATSSQELLIHGVSGSRPSARPSCSHTCTAVFRSQNTCAGTAPARCSHSLTHPYRGSHTYSRNSASAP